MGFNAQYTYGSQTLFADILRVLGAENVAATHGLLSYDRVTDEHIVRWDPEWIVTGADAGQTDAARARLLERPSIAATTAARQGQVVVLEYRVFLPLSPVAAQLVDALAQAFYSVKPLKRVANVRSAALQGCLPGPSAGLTSLRHVGSLCDPTKAALFGGSRREPPGGPPKRFARRRKACATSGRGQAAGGGR